MRALHSRIIAGFLLFALACSQAVIWSQVPSIRSGQINNILSLTTSSDTLPATTDITTTFSNTTGLSTANLQYGISLISYESWMTNTFSYNITVSLTNVDITVQFLVLDNTFFTKAKTHYIVVDRSAVNFNGPLGATPPAIPVVYNDIEAHYGCYLTTSLLSGSTLRTQGVGGRQTSAIFASNPSGLVMYSMLAGMQLSNSVGTTNYVDIKTSLNSSGLYYDITVQENNELVFLCISTVIIDPAVNQMYEVTNIEYQSMVLSAANATGTGLASIGYAARYDGTDRMFFGISKMNLSMSDTRYLNVETSNISLIKSMYAYNSAMTAVTYNMIFYAMRRCASTSQYYYPLTYACVAACPTNSKARPLATAPPNQYLLCQPCHYSCSTCTLPRNQLSCDNPCSGSDHRTYQSSNNTCICDSTYTDIGQRLCVKCNTVMIGCSTCTSSTYCTDCDNITFVINNSTHRCQCKPNFYLTSGYCLGYPGCLNAQYFNNVLVCVTCDATLNYTLASDNVTCKCLPGYIFNATTLACDYKCGGPYTMAGLCNNGNLGPGTGCDRSCNVEPGYYCYVPTASYYANGQPGLSVCVLKAVISIKYLYSQRVINSNKFTMAFSLSPAQGNLSANSFIHNFDSTLPIANQEIVFDSTKSVLLLSGEYVQTLEGTSQIANITFDGFSFYADPITVNFSPIGVNAALVLSSLGSINGIMWYLSMGVVVVALALSIFSSIVGLKMVGIELLIPIQLIYFSLATISNYNSYSSLLSNLKYANGYNTLTPYVYSRTYSQLQNLMGMEYETEFLLSTNIMLMVYVAILIWLLIHHLRLKYKEHQIDKLMEQKVDEKPTSNEKNDSEEDREEAEQDEEKVKLRRNKPKDSELEFEQYKLREDHQLSFRVFTFEVDRFYFIFYVILFNQIMFGFSVMSLNTPIASFYFSEQINVIVCNFLFIFFMGNLVFIAHDQKSNKMIVFTSIRDEYAYYYLFLDIIIITVLSLIFQQSFSTYLVCALSLAFVILTIKERPYNSEFCTFENLVALYLNIMLVLCLVLICVIKQGNLTEIADLSIAYMILGLITVGEILTIIRIVMKVNFKKAFDDLKNPHNDDEGNRKKERVIQKNLDLLEEEQKIEILPPDSVRNGLFTPKDKMIDWESRNTEEYRTIKQMEAAEGLPEQQPIQEEEASEAKQEKLNQLELLKRRLRSNLKLKKEGELKTE